jgi:transcriptional regulator with XRE-family HTH domain
MGNAVKKLREALGWSQAAFAQAIGRSYQSVQAYERGVKPPPEVIERMKALAAEHNLADIGLELSSADWQPRQIFEPREVIHPAAKGALPTSPGRDGAAPARDRDNNFAADREGYHRMLDRILDSGHKVAMAAVTQNLFAFDHLVRVDQKSAAKKKKMPSGKHV